MNQLAPISAPETRTVCGGVITDPNDYPSALHRGQRVYFCLRACLRVFESHPDRFMAGEIEHPTEESDG